MLGCTLQSPHPHTTILCTTEFTADSPGVSIAHGQTLPLGLGLSRRFDLRSRGHFFSHPGVQRREGGANIYRLSFAMTCLSLFNSRRNSRL